MEARHVAIIGAGAAGIACASELSRAGIPITFIEARNRIGGRIHTIRDRQNPLPVELGAEFIHGADEVSFSLAGAAHALVCDADGPHFHKFQGKLIDMADFWKELDNVMGGINKKASSDETFREYLNKRFPESDPANALHRSLALAFVEGFDAAHPERISARSLGDESNASGQQQFRLPTGYDSLLQPLLASLNRDITEIHFSTVVTDIRWKKGSVEVIASRAAPLAPHIFKASRALITLPLGVLQAPENSVGAVRFNPPLPDKTEAASKLAVGPVIKVVLRFREPFWENHKTDGIDLKKMSFVHSRHEPIQTWWTTLPIRSSVLTGWCAGPAADQLAGASEETILGRALDSLAHLLKFERTKLESFLHDFFIADWQADPFARGAYSYTPVGGEDAAKKLSEPVNDTLFFAGEATHHNGPAGTVPSAIETGKRAASEILSSF